METIRIGKMRVDLECCKNKKGNKLFKGRNLLDSTIRNVLTRRVI